MISGSIFQKSQKMNRDYTNIKYSASAAGGDSDVKTQLSRVGPVPSPVPAASNRPVKQPPRPPPQ